VRGERRRGGAEGEAPPSPLPCRRVDLAAGLGMIRCRCCKILLCNLQVCREQFAADSEALSPGYCIRGRCSWLRPRHVEPACQPDVSYCELA
jgi:hypothetical protein